MYRSWMFVPGNNEKHLRKVKDLTADVIIYDLEDAVPDERKASARVQVKETIASRSEKVNFVRVNALDTRYFIDDINGIMTEHLSGIMLPKVNSREDILIAAYLLGQLEEKHQLPKGGLAIVPLIETAKGLENASDIAKASERVLCLSFGAEDYTLDLNIEPANAEEALTYARSKLVVASKAADKEAPIDSVYTDFHNEAGLEQAALASKRYGFQGKLLIHPKQIDIVNRVFSPTDEQIAEAKRIVELYEASLQKGEGAVQLDGKMIDVPIAERAKRILAYAEQEQTT